MHHRSSLRAQADVPVTVYADGYAFEGRTLDLSTRGMRFTANPGLVYHAARPFFVVKLAFATDAPPATALARTAWWNEREAAFYFISMGETDRLSVAEKMDDSVRHGLALA